MTRGVPVTLLRTWLSHYRALNILNGPIKKRLRATNRSNFKMFITTGINRKLIVAEHTFVGYSVAF